MATFFGMTGKSGGGIYIWRIDHWLMRAKSTSPYSEKSADSGDVSWIPFLPSFYTCWRGFLFKIDLLAFQWTFPKKGYRNGSQNVPRGTFWPKVTGIFDFSCFFFAVWLKGPEEKYTVTLFLQIYSNPIFDLSRFSFHESWGSKCYSLIFLW